MHCASVGGYIWICLAKAAPDFEPVRQHLDLFPAAPLHQSQDCLREHASSSTPIGSSYGKTIASAITASANHPELLRTFPEIRPQPASKAPKAIRSSCAVDALGIDRSAEPVQDVADGQYRTTRIRSMEGGRATRWTARRRCAGRCRRITRARYRNAAAVPLSDHLESRLGGPRHYLSSAADQRRPKRSSRPNGWCTRMPSKASTTT